MKFRYLGFIFQVSITKLDQHAAFADEVFDTMEGVRNKLL